MKGLIAIAFVVFALISAPAAQADIASDIAANMPAEVVIANALAEGMKIEEIMIEIARIVGSDNIGLFATAARNVLALAMGIPATAPDVTLTVRSIVGAAAAGNFAGTAAGKSYAGSSATFQAQPDQTIAAVLASGDIVDASLSQLAPVVVANRLVLSEFFSAFPDVGGDPFRNVQGRVIEQALCEIIASERGCVISQGS